MPKSRSADPTQCSRICPATPTASPSPTAACSRSMTKAVAFKWKNYRSQGPDRYKTTTLTTDEFIRRFLIHVLPRGFHRIRHYGLFAKTFAADNVARARQLPGAQKPQREPRRYRSLRWRSLRADLSLPRRTHVYHRDVRTWIDATPSTDGANHRRQDRHVIRIQKPLANKFARWLSGPSAGAGRICSNNQPTAQKRQQLIAFAGHTVAIGTGSPLAPQRGDR